MKKSTRQELINFFLIAFGWMWLINLPRVLNSFNIITLPPLLSTILGNIAVFGPMVAAFLLTGIKSKKEGLRSLWEHKFSKNLAATNFITGSYYGVDHPVHSSIIKAAHPMGVWIIAGYDCPGRFVNMAIRGTPRRIRLAWLCPWTPANKVQSIGCQLDTGDHLGNLAFTLALHPGYNAIGYPNLGISRTECVCRYFIPRDRKYYRCSTPLLDNIPWPMDQFPALVDPGIANHFA